MPKISTDNTRELNAQRLVIQAASKTINRDFPQIEDIFHGGSLTVNQSMNQSYLYFNSDIRAVFLLVSPKEKQ